MIINFSNKVQLGEWTDATPIGILSSNSFHRIYKMNDRYLIGVSVREHQWHKSISPDRKSSFAMFYHDLSILHDYFPPNFEGDLEVAKQSVDNFLIKMSRLTAFL